MTASPRQLARSSRLWALSVLAWLMLVMQAVPVAAPAHPAPASMAAHAAMAMADGPADACHHASDHVVKPVAASPHDDCCGKAATPHCQCAAMCASALLPLPAWRVAAASPAAGVAEPIERAAPRQPAPPPLRPPQA